MYIKGAMLVVIRWNLIKGLGIYLQTYLKC